MTKVLFVTYDFPYPANTGGKNRAYNLIKKISSDNEVYLYSFVRKDFNPEHINYLHEIGVKEIKIFKRRELKKFSNIALTLLHNSSIFKTLYYEKKCKEEILDFVYKNNIEIVHFESSYTGYYIGSELKRHGAKQILGTENLEHALYLDYAKNIGKKLLRPFFYQQSQRLKSEEISMIKKSDLCIAVTKSEAEFISKYSKKECVIVPNGIDTDEFSYKFSDKIKKNLLFVGNFSYFPNVDAMNFFYNNVFEKIPDRSITLTIIGKKGNEVLKFDDERVIFKEFVENILDEYRNADMLVFPVRIGGGTNFKVLEAMALGVPIVAIPQRLEGLEAVSDRDFLQAQSAEEFVAQIQRLYEDETLRKKITINARNLVDKTYSWDTIADTLKSAWRKTLKD